VAGRIKSPALVLHGELDELVDVVDAEALAETMGGSECVEVPGAGHLANIDNPEAFAARLRAHLGVT
jgi:pimeloyl-ACP methyl ester carboxylesterase